MSDQSGQAGASAAAAGTATGVLRIHLGHVAENLTLSFLLGGAAAALTQGLMPDSLVQNLTLRLIIAVVPLILCVMITDIGRGMTMLLSRRAPPTPFVHCCLLMLA